MNLLTMILLALGGFIQFGGIAYAVIGFDDINVPLIIGAVIAGGILESAGIFWHILSSR